MVSGNDGHTGGSHLTGKGANFLRLILPVNRSGTPKYKPAPDHMPQTQWCTQHEPIQCHIARPKQKSLRRWKRGGLEKERRGGDLLYRKAVPSAQRSLTAVFGMGTGGASAL